MIWVGFIWVGLDWVGLGWVGNILKWLFLAKNTFTDAVNYNYFNRIKPVFLQMLNITTWSNSRLAFHVFFFLTETTLSWTPRSCQWPSDRRLCCCLLLWSLTSLTSTTWGTSHLRWPFTTTTCASPVVSVLQGTTNHTCISWDDSDR